LAEYRAAFKNPGLYRNLEAVAKRYEAYINRNDPEAGTAFRARMLTMLGKKKPMRRDDEFFGERELDLIYVGKRLADAQSLETLLTEAGWDYYVKADEC